MKKRTSKLIMLLLGLSLLAGCFKTPSSEKPPVSSEQPPVTSVTTEEPPVSSEEPSEPPVSSEEPLSSEVEPGEPIKLGDAAAALADPNEMYLQVGEKVNLTYARIVDNVPRIQFTVEDGVAYDALKLFVKFPGEVGKRYKVNAAFTAAATFTGTINGERFDFIRGENNLEFYYDELENEVSIAFVFGFNEEGLGLKANNITFGEVSISERVYDDPETTLAVDGDISDWSNLKAFENTVGVHSNTAEVKHKSVDFYASLTSTGLYLAAEAYHDILIEESEHWWQSTNFEIFIKGNNQYWVSARKVDGAFTKRDNVTEAAMVTTPLTGEGVANFRTVAEMFIANANLPEAAVVGGEIRVGFAWKTDGDLLDNGEAAGGGLDCYWVPKGTWTDNADQTFVTINGIFKQTQLTFEPTTMTIDGDLTDWEEKAAYTTNKIYIEGSDATNHKNVTFMAFLNDEGLFLAALAHHDVLINNEEMWHFNTNFEFFLNGGNQYYVTAAGQVSYGKGIIVTQAYKGEPYAEYESVAEFFIPRWALPEGDMHRVGFAWKTNGDTATGLGGSGGGPDAWWFEAGHFPNNADEQYYVTAEGLFRTDPTPAP